MKIRLIIGLLAVPASGWAQIGVGPATPVMPSRVAVPEPKIPVNPTSPTDFNAPGRTAGGAKARAGGGGAVVSGGAGGYSGGDMVLNEGNPSLWGGIRKKRMKIPKYHTVKKGDTLWDICRSYYSDPWSWPQLWAYNMKITNPHWIYPGDRVRLLGGRAVNKGGEKITVRRLHETITPPITLKQNGFADPKELAKAGEIEGSRQERLLLSERDEIYAKAGGKFKPKVGQHYSIYRVRKRLSNSSGKKVGYLVEIRGTARVKKAPKGKAAVAVITESINPIERGDRIGPLRRRYKRLPAKPAQKNLSGEIVGGLARTTFFGLNELVFIDRGKNHGIEKGNRFLVLQRGDGYRRILQNKDQPNSRFPREAVAEISVIDVREKASVGMVTRALKEIQAGDYIKMRRGY